jgi:hypothetical protein
MVRKLNEVTEEAKNLVLQEYNDLKRRYGEKMWLLKISRDNATRRYGNSRFENTMQR